MEKSFSLSDRVVFEISQCQKRIADLILRKNRAISAKTARTCDSAARAQARINHAAISMPRLPDPDQMRGWDRAAIDFGIPETMLMENAGRACVQFLEQTFGPLRGKKICIFMGSGNNGGDAACAARHLADSGALPVVFHCKPLEQCRGACAWHTRLALADGVIFLPISATAENMRDFLLARFMEAAGAFPEIIIDGLLGTGFIGSLRPDLEKIVNGINLLAASLRCFTLAIDVPSGLNAVTGTPRPTAIRANATVALAAAKPGIILPSAEEWTGRVCVKKIGMPKAINYESGTLLLDGHCLFDMPTSCPQSHKNQYGHIVVIGGGPGLEGAAHMAAAAALRAGAGLATACAPAHSLALIKNGWPEIMTLALNRENPLLWPDRIADEAMALFKRADALVVGPGMGRGQDALLFLAELLALPGRPPTVFDADALVLFSRRPDLLKKLSENDAMTPHPGEAAALLNLSAAEAQADRKKTLKMLCDISGATAVLKGAGTLVSRKNGPVLLCPYDIPQLAVGGSGDILSGCLGALFGARYLKNIPYLYRAGMAVATHAIAGLICAEKFPHRGARAADIANAICHVREFIEKKPLTDFLPWP